MISISGVSVQFSGQFLFDDISLAITESDRIGLVGKNGAGKSTLLKLIIGLMKPESGSISKDNNTTLGYLPQEIPIHSQKTVYEEAATAFALVLQLGAEIEKKTEELTHRTDYDSPEYLKLVADLTDAQDHYQRLDGLTMREQIEKILKGLGFVNGDFDRPMTEFSGGWQMRVELAKILLQKPSFILLDEPTNHLDIESIMWLEDFLIHYDGGVVLISHDIAFLDAVSTRTVELVNGNAYDYRVPYSEFVALRQQRHERQVTEAKRQEKFIEHTETLINKFRAKKSKAKFAQTLITKLEKIEKVEIDDLEKDAIRFRFPDAPRSGRVVVNMINLSKSYDKTRVLDNINFTLERGEKVAFIGKNGEGKTTLTKIISGIEPYEGLFELGHNVSIGYFEQRQAETLDGNQTVFQTIDDVATGDMRFRVRNLLGAFLFSGEAVDKKVMVLSGGEKSRLALAKMLLEPVNLLILDEPTNHLDVRAKEVLKEALKSFNGSIIVVSHDREFLQGLTNKVYHFQNKKIREYQGDIYDFLRDTNIQTLDELGMKSRTAPEKELTETEAKQERINRREALKNLEKDIKKQESRVKKSEQVIAELETIIAGYEQQMSGSDFYAQPEEMLKSAMSHYQGCKQQLQQEVENWELLALELEELEQQRKESG
ncbi:MAG: ABC-F family ATP-binding cassette domain-containing protein [Sphingobacteriales bacterium]|nr:MAG: ABC-F family ATP-binding cassette domain-containing protein [Sphingobacteriales bacterium]